MYPAWSILHLSDSLVERKSYAGVFQDCKSRFFTDLWRGFSVSRSPALYHMDFPAGEGLDEKNTSVHFAAGIFISVLVPSDRAFVYEAFGRECILENPLAASDGGDDSLCVLPSLKKALWN